MKQYPHVLTPWTEETDIDLKHLHDTAMKMNLSVGPIGKMSWRIADIVTEETEFESGPYKRNSFTRNFYNVLAAAFTDQAENMDKMVGEAGNLGLADSSYFSNISYGNKTAIGVFAAETSSYGTPLGVFATSNTAENGIMLEGVDAPENFNATDYFPIPHGTSAGQLVRVAPIKDVSANFNEETNAYTSSVSRIFKNQSTEPVTIYNTVVSMDCPYNVTSQTQYMPAVLLGHLIERTKFPEPIVLLPGKLIEVTYSMVFSYPEPVNTDTITVAYTTTTDDTLVTKETNSLYAALRFIKETSNIKTVTLSSSENAVIPTSLLPSFFDNAAVPSNLDMSQLDGSNIIGMVELFVRPSLTTFLPPKNLTKIRKLNNFAGSESMRTPWNLTECVFDDSCDFSNVENMRSMFGAYSSGYAGNLTKIVMPKGKITGPLNMTKFAYCKTKLELIDFSQLELPADTNLTNAFSLAGKTGTVAYAATQANVDMLNNHVNQPSTWQWQLKPQLTPSSVVYTSLFEPSPTTVEFETIDELKAWIALNKYDLKTLKISNDYASATEYSLEDLLSSSISLETLDMSGYDAANLTSLASFILNCYELTELILPTNLNKCTSVNSMFSSCNSLTEITFPADMNIAAVENWDNCMAMCNDLQHVAFAGTNKTVSSSASFVNFIYSCDKVSMYDFSAVDFSGADLSNIITTSSIKAATVTAWAKDQTNADLLNSAAGKPSYVTFVPKP